MLGTSVAPASSPSRCQGSGPIYCLPGAPSSGPEIMIRYRSLGLVAAYVLSLWLIASFLHQHSSQKDLCNIAKIHPGICHCPSNFSRKCNCSSEVQTCSACLHMPGESDWFDRRFDSTVEPLQRPQDPMSNDALILWLGLERVKSEKEVENKQQQLIKAPPLCPLGHVVSNCWVCAVVGNSMSLRSSGLGFRINQHEVVLRMNQAPVRGFEADVGNRTTMRIIYPGIASPWDPGTQLLLLPLNSSGLEWFLSVLHKQTSMWKQKKPWVLVISLYFLRYIQKSWLENHGQYPSLEFVALLYALHTCDQAPMLGHLIQFQLVKKLLQLIPTSQLDPELRFCQSWAMRIWNKG
uniref:beta-D-galactosyl-(1->3)-N-acetyl-beta-D-galactosaminide alpha-2,3-sialyltransferase n=1 Tax=Pongo abelii TaxID=9601 RepID=A0A8I5T0L3_PONAB